MVGEFPGLTKLDENENVVNDLRLPRDLLLAAGAVVRNRSRPGDPRSVVVRTVLLGDVRMPRASPRPGSISHHRASLFILCVLCALCSAVAAGTSVASGNRSPRHPSQTARACRRSRAKHHRHCPAAHAGKKSHRKHGRGSGAKPSAPKGVSKGAGSSGSSTDPWTGAPAPVIPGAGSGGSGSSPGSSAGGGSAPTKTPATPAGPVHVQVTAEDTSGYHFILSRTAVPAGPVAIEFVNHGQDEHNLHAVEPVEGAEAGGLRGKRQAGRPPGPDAQPACRLLHAVLLAAGARGERDEGHAEGGMNRGSR